MLNGLNPESIESSIKKEISNKVFKEEECNITNITDKNVIKDNQSWDKLKRKVRVKSLCEPKISRNSNYSKRNSLISRRFKSKAH